MGITSMILGILSFLISLGWFEDLSLILSVVGSVLGIIAIVKKQGRGMGIAGVILSILALTILFSAPSTDGQTGTGITSDTGNGTNRVAVSIENVLMEKVAITKSGDFVIKITNNNEGSVCLTSITTVYKDANGEFVEKVQADSWFVCIPAKSYTYVYNDGYDKKFSKYPNYEFTCELANIWESFVYSDINIKSNNTGEQIAVTLTNNTDTPLTSCEIVIVYYKKDKIIGIETGYASETVSAGKNAYINVDYPVDSNYDEVAFDKYEVHYINAGID